MNLMNNTDPIATKAAAKDIADDTIHCPRCGCAQCCSVIGLIVLVMTHTCRALMLENKEKGA